MILPDTTRALVSAMRIVNNILADPGCTEGARVSCPRPQRSQEAEELMGLLILAGNELVELRIKAGGGL